MRVVAGSLLVHAVGVPVAVQLGRSACPLLDETGFVTLGGVMLTVVLVAWAAYWAAQWGWLGIWRRGRAGAELHAEETCSLFRGPFRGVFIHVVTFALGTLVGAFVLHFAAAHTAWNPRFWYSTMLAAGVVATLNGAYVEFELARDMRSVRNERWAYRSGQTVFQLQEIVLFALATLPVSIMAAVIYRRAVLDSEMVLTAGAVLSLLVQIGGLFIVWSLVTVGLLSAVARYASQEVQLLIRELDKPQIPRRAHLTTGGVWGETAASLNVAAENLEQRARLETAVRVYVGDDLAEATRKDDITARRGEHAELTLLFSDIRGFTQRSADKTPDEVLTLLDEYFEMAVDAVERHGGHVDKFIGDGLMVWFDPPPGSADMGAKRAVAAAQDLLAGVRELSAKLVARGLDELEIGVGLHAGPVVRGNLGAGKRKQWTVIGDTVNLASRVEGMTKQVGRELLFTESVAAALPDDAVEALGEFEIRGQPRPVKLFAPSGLSG